MMVGDSYIETIAYKEGWQAYIDNRTSLIDNPYEGVMNKLRDAWELGWWDAFYSEE